MVVLIGTIEIENWFLHSVVLFLLSFALCYNLNVSYSDATLLQRYPTGAVIAVDKQTMFCYCKGY